MEIVRSRPQPARAISTGGVVVNWRFLLGLTILVILFIPIRRYALPGNLPLQLEPYRLVVALVTLAWMTSLLVDPRVRVRGSGLDWPLFLVVGVYLGSVASNGSRVHALEIGPDVMKKLMFFLSFVVVFYLIVSVVERLADVDALVKVLVGGGTVVAALALVEYRTGFNAFNYLARVMPFLKLLAIPDEGARGGRLRAYASAEHPIALGAAFVILIPLAVYVARRSSKRRWLLATGVLVMGSIATMSRTSIIMLAVVLLVFLVLRPAETKRLWPVLFIAIALAKVALPGSLGTLKYEFFPAGGIVQDQAADAGGYGQGRIADLGPAFKEFKQRPLLGQGYGTRVTGQPLNPNNTQILDDQWLKTLLETGFAGIIGWLWLFARFLRRAGRAAKADRSSRGWLLVAITASVYSYAVSMFTYDAFSFIQVTFLVFILLALGAVVLRSDEREGAGSPPARFESKYRAVSNGRATSRPQARLRSSHSR